MFYLLDNNSPGLKRRALMVQIPTGKEDIFDSYNLHIEKQTKHQDRKYEKNKREKQGHC